MCFQLGSFTHSKSAACEVVVWSCGHRFLLQSPSPLSFTNTKNLLRQTAHSHLLGFERMVFVSMELQGFGVFLVFGEGTKIVIRHNSKEDAVILSLGFLSSDFRIL